MAVVLYIDNVIAVQAFQSTPARHPPVVTVGIIAGIAAWGVLMAMQSLKIAGFGKDRPLSAETVAAYREMDNWIDGAFALSAGFVLSSMILASIVVAIIDRRYGTSAIWCGVAAACSAVEMIHSYELIDGESQMTLFVPGMAVGDRLRGLRADAIGDPVCDRDCRF